MSSVSSAVEKRHALDSFCCRYKGMSSRLQQMLYVKDNRTQHFLSLAGRCRSMSPRCGVVIPLRICVSECVCVAQEVCVCERLRGVCVAQISVRHQTQIVACQSAAAPSAQRSVQRLAENECHL